MNLTLTIPLLALLSLTSTIANPISSSPSTHLSKRNSLTKCTKTMAESLFKSPAKPPNASAVICYKNEFDYIIDNQSPTNYQRAGRRNCSTWMVLGWKAHRFDCHFLIGNNKFEIKGDGGWENVSIWRDTVKCTWGDKKLQCRE